MTTPSFTPADLREIVAEVLADLRGATAVSSPAAAPTAPAAAPPPAAPAAARHHEPVSGPGADVDVADPTAHRRVPHVPGAANPVGLENLVGSTTARIGVGRAGPRPTTSQLLLFQADHAVTQDAIFGDVPTALLEQFSMFTVQSQVHDSDEFLIRPDLGRVLSDEGRALVAERCVKGPDVQIVAGDGLSAAAITNNLDKIYPVLEQGLKAAGLSVGTPFFVKYCRVGIINDINTIVGAGAVVLLIGERPGLGVADALSVYSGYQPGPGKSDAHRDVVCMITEHGGTNPLEAGAFVVNHIRTVLREKASGVDLRLAQSQGRGQ